MKSKYNLRGKKLTKKEKKQLKKLESEYDLLLKTNKKKKVIYLDLFRKYNHIIRPIRIILGILLFLVILFILSSFVMTTIHRIV